jgi:glycosyltransferase involved in cell wall biosynthesis
MKNSIQLSIVLTTHTKSNYFNSLLENVLLFSKNNVEVIVVNDAADTVTAQSIGREIQKTENQRVYLFEHEKRTGRGASLNEALVHASGSMVWAPLRADRLNESLLFEAVRRFKADPVAFWVMDYNLPQTPAEWVQAADEGDLPDDSCLVWNRDIIEPEEFFFNPFMGSLHGAELAFRLMKENTWYKTDPFFVVADDQSRYAVYTEIQEFLFSALRLNEHEEERKELLKQLSESENKVRDKVSDDELLIQARSYLQNGEANLSLELIDKFLKRNPEHHEAIRIKITSLEKLRRYVEASELKHNLQKGPEISAEEPEEKVQEPEQKPVQQKEETEVPDSEGQSFDDSEKIPAEAERAEESAQADQKEEEKKRVELSVVIPTTAHGKLVLESALVHLEKAVDSNTTELIVIDNASIDDTLDYLEQLKEVSFLNIKVITNPANKGFAASVNQGIDAAEGDLILVLHNDVQLSENSVELLKKALRKLGSAVLAAPLLNTSHIQAQKAGPSENGELISADRVDSCCFMIRKDLEIRFDEEYRLCFFEMDDFCSQIAGQGLEMVIVTETVVNHQRGNTTTLMGIDLTPELRWQNRARYYKKWNLNRGKRLPEQGSHPERFQKLGAPPNPMDPEPEWVQTVQDYLTSEVRTEILRGDWSEDELLTIVLTLLIADERELLRTLEDRLEALSPDKFLLMLFVHYYFRKNIFSRCMHYMNMADQSHPVFELYKLKILVADKEFEEAAPLLNDLLEKYPSSPELYFIAGEIYKKNGEEGEAKSFFAMAGQLDPFRFQADESAFQIKL